MKIAYIMYPGACYMGKGDGSKMQAEIWLKELEKKGILLTELILGDITTGRNMTLYTFLDLVCGTMTSYIGESVLTLILYSHPS